MRTTERELREMFSDVWYMVRSPLSADRRDWFTVAATGAGFAGLLAVDKPVDQWVVRHPEALGLPLLGPFREKGGALNRLVTARQLVPLSAVLIGAGAVSDRRGLREAGLGCTKPLQGVTAESMDRLQAYAWPGNIRELQNVLERSCVMATTPTVEIEDALTVAPAPRATTGNLITLDENERAHIRRALAAAGGRIHGPRGAANMLDINPSTLRSRMEKLGIEAA